MSPQLDSVNIMRVVVRESTSEDLIDAVVTDLMDIIQQFEQSGSPESILAALDTARSSSAHPASKAEGKRHAGAQETKAGDGVGALVTALALHLGLMQRRAEGRTPTGYGRPC